MNVYLPIAEMSVNMFLILGLGGVTGILSGMFGVGGGFLITPLLIFIGVPPAVSVSTAANQIIASSVSGFLAHWRRDNDVQGTQNIHPFGRRARRPDTVTNSRLSDSIMGLGSHLAFIDGALSGSHAGHARFRVFC